MLYRLSQFLLPNFEGKYIRMQICVSDWMGRKNFTGFDQILTGFDQIFVHLW